MAFLDRREECSLLRHGQPAAAQQVLQLVMESVACIGRVYRRGVVEQEQVGVHMQRKLAQLRSLQHARAVAPHRLVYVVVLALVWGMAQALLWWPLIASDRLSLIASDGHLVIYVVPFRSQAVPGAPPAPERAVPGAPPAPERAVPGAPEAPERTARRLRPWRAREREAALQSRQDAAHFRMHSAHRAQPSRAQPMYQRPDEAAPSREKQQCGYRGEELDVEPIRVDEAVDGAHRPEQLCLEELHLRSGAIIRIQE